MAQDLASIAIFCALFGLCLTECPNGWVYFNHSCYLFGHGDYTFQDAAKYCQHFSANLVNIETQQENSFIKSFLDDFKDHNYWNGITDEVIEGLWTLYPSETPVPFTDWYSSQPDEGKTANCGVLWAGVQYQWADQPCSVLWKAICEKASDTETVIG